MLRFAYRKRVALWLSLICLAVVSTACFGGSEDPLVRGAGRGDLPAVERLLDKGHDPNASVLGGYTALMEAAGRGDLEMVKALLSHGAEASAKTTHGWTALMSVAARSGDLEIARLLIERGADPCGQHDQEAPPQRTAEELARANGHPAVAEVIDSFARC